MNITWQFATAVVNIGHLKAEDLRAMQDNALSPAGNYGLYWLNNIADSLLVRPTQTDDWEEMLKRIGVSDEALENIRKVLAGGFDAVQFHPDADQVDELTYLYEEECEEGNGT